MNITSSLVVMNSKQIKELMKLLEFQFGICEKLDFVYLRNTKDKVYVINRDLERIDFEKLKIDSVGLYLGVFQKDGFRLSIEGSQLLFKYATKNILELTLEQKHEWLKGKDVSVSSEDNRLVIVKWHNDILGCGKVKENVLLNTVPKARRLSVVNE